MTPTPTPTRRELLASVAAGAGAVGSAGCVSFGGTSSGFHLTAYRPPEGLDYHVEDPLEIRSKYTPDYSDAYKRETVEELVETGTVSTRAWELGYRLSWGRERRDLKRCLRYDGTYYRVHVESSRDVARERWTIYLDWTADGPAEDDTVAARPVTSLSERDRAVFDAVLEELPATGRRLQDPVDYGVVYHRELDAGESELVPDPPFDYLEKEWETPRVVTRRIDDERVERTVSVEPVAESESECLEYARSEFPEARLRRSDLSDAARDVVDEVAGPGDAIAYEEEPPLSDGLEEVLERLGIADELRPHEEYEEPVEFAGALATYQDAWTVFGLEIYP